MSANKFDLTGKVVFISGSSTGLGKAMAMEFGAAGAKVALNYANNEARANQTFEQFRAAGYDGVMLRGSAILEEDVKRMIQETKDQLGPVDCIVVNATPDQPQKPIEQYDWDFYQSMLDFFIKSPYLLTRAVLADMKQRKSGRIINIGSEVFEEGVPNFTAYVAAKGGQNGFTRSLAKELAPWGITVNTIAPAWIPVERHEKDPQEAKDAYLADLPSKRWGVPKEVADLALFLASDESSYVSGQNIAVNGAHTVS
ncbi:MAG: SDR family oxidoreductase [Candidatus Hydrogenedentota bacterium]